MRLFFIIAVLLLTCASRAAEPDLPTLPALTDPPSDDYLIGKFVWADLFTNDVERVRPFYEQVFGWEWRPFLTEPTTYGVLYNAGEPVAGIAHRDSRDPDIIYGRWVHYVSVADIAAIGGSIVAGGGEGMLTDLGYPDRGDFSVYNGPEGETFGIIRSQTGDPPDVRARHGDFIWRQLFAADVAASTAFYSEIFDYEVYQDTDEGNLVQVFLAHDDFSRAAIGQLTESAETPPIWLGYVRVADMATMLEAVTANGGKIMLAPTEGVQHGKLAVVADPVGTLIALLHWDYDDPDAPAETSGAGAR